MANEGEQVAVLLQPEQDEDIEAGTSRPTTQSLLVTRSAAIVAAVGLVVLVVGFAATSQSLPTIVTQNTVSFAATSKPSACAQDHTHFCPKEWADGGYHCQTHDGCRTMKDGPFPLNSCKKQCIFPKHEKKRRVPNDVPACPDDHTHWCPKGWTAGGYHCTHHNGCRHVEQGPFPKADCKAQCFFAADKVKNGDDQQPKGNGTNVPRSTDITKGNETKGNETKGNATKGNEKKGKETKTMGNETKGNATKGDETKGNATKGNDTKGNETKTMGNETKGNATKGNETKGNATKNNDTE